MNRSMTFGLVSLILLSFAPIGEGADHSTPGWSLFSTATGDLTARVTFETSTETMCDASAANFNSTASPNNGIAVKEEVYITNGGGGVSWSTKGKTTVTFALVDTNRGGPGDLTAVMGFDCDDPVTILFVETGHEATLLSTREASQGGVQEKVAASWAVPMASPSVAFAGALMGTTGTITEAHVILDANNDTHRWSHSAVGGPFLGSNPTGGQVDGQRGQYLLDVQLERTGLPSHYDAMLVGFDL